MRQRAATAAALRLVAHMLHQRRAHLLELVDLLLLLVDALIQRLHDVLLVRQFDFNIDKAVFVGAHGILPAGKHAFYRLT